MCLILFIKKTIQNFCEKKLISIKKDNCKCQLLDETKNILPKKFYIKNTLVQGLRGSNATGVNVSKIVTLKTL